jgi:hypothetical protein
MKLAAKPDKSLQAGQIAWMVNPAGPAIDSRVDL